MTWIVMERGGEYNDEYTEYFDGIGRPYQVFSSQSEAINFCNLLNLQNWLKIVIQDHWLLEYQNEQTYHSLKDLNTWREDLDLTWPEFVQRYYFTHQSLFDRIYSISLFYVDKTKV